MYKAVLLSILILLCAAHKVKQTNRLVGAYIVQPDPTKAQFQIPLSYALAEKPYFWKSALVLIETQLVNGINYRFTFRNSNGNLTQRVVYSPFEGLPPLNSTDIILIGAPKQIEPSQRILDLIYAKYPQVKGYFISGMESQIVAGTLYRVGFQKNVENDQDNKYRVRYAYATVLHDLDKVDHVQLVEWVDEYGYTIEQIGKFTSQFPDYEVVRIENIWTLSGEGLKITFAKQGKTKILFAYQNGWSQRIFIL